MKRFVPFLCAAILACSANDSAAPHAGTLQLALTRGGTTDGAIVLVISGGPVTSVAGALNYEVASNADGRGTHILVTGDIGAGNLATINVPDVTRASDYVVTVEQVADRTTFGLLDPARYEITVAPQQ